MSPTKIPGTMPNNIVKILKINNKIVLIELIERDLSAVSSEDNIILLHPFDLICFRRHFSKASQHSNRQ